MSGRRDPSTLTSVCNRKDAGCFHCKRKIGLGVEMITAYDGVSVVTYHVECPAFPPAAQAAAALFADLARSPR